MDDTEVQIMNTVNSRRIRLLADSVSTLGEELNHDWVIPQPVPFGKRFHLPMVIR
jgi:hypothetical protein